jgi:CRP-like cAMP-binding protein
MSVDLEKILTTLLGPLAPDELAWVAARVEFRRYQPGFAVFHEGSTPRHMVLLLEGRLRIAKLRADKRQESIAWVEPVALIGHAAVVGRFLHPTTVMAREPCLCLHLPATLLEPSEEKASRRPALALLRASLLGMNAQLRAANARLFHLAGERELLEALAGDLGAWSLPPEP